MLDLAVHSQVTPTPSTTPASPDSRDRTLSSAPSSTPAAARSTATSSWTSLRSARRPRRRRRPCGPSLASACSSRRASSSPEASRPTWRPAARAPWAVMRSPWSRYRTDASACVASCRMPGTTTPSRSSTRATTRWSSTRAPEAPRTCPRSARRRRTRTRGSPLTLVRPCRSTPSPLGSTRILSRRPLHPYHNRRRHLRHHPRRPRRHRRSHPTSLLRHPILLGALPTSHSRCVGTTSSVAQTMAFARMGLRAACPQCAHGAPTFPTARRDAPPRRHHRSHHPVSPCHRLFLLHRRLLHAQVHRHRLPARRPRRRLHRRRRRRPMRRRRRVCRLGRRRQIHRQRRRRPARRNRPRHRRHACASLGP